MAKYGIKGIDSQKLKQYNGKKSTFRLEQREKERDFKEGGESMAATIADVANLAGCSINTVSRAFRVAEKNIPTIRPGSTSISNRKASHGSRSSRCGTADPDGLRGHCSRGLKKLRQGTGTASVMRGYLP